MLIASEYLDLQHYFFKQETILLLEKIKNLYGLSFDVLDGASELIQDRNADGTFFISFSDSKTETFSKEYRKCEITIEIASPYDDSNEYNENTHERIDNQTPLKSFVNAVYEVLNAYLYQPVSTSILDYSYTVNGTTRQSFPYDWERYIRQTPMLMDYMQNKNRGLEEFVFFPVVYCNLSQYAEGQNYRISFEFDPIKFYPYNRLEKTEHILKELTGCNMDEVNPSQFPTLNEETIKQIGAWQNTQITQLLLD